MSLTGGRRIAVLLAVAGSASVSACSGGSTTAPSATTTTARATTSSSTTSTTSIPPSTLTPAYDGPTGVPAAARAHTDAGRIAFATYYVQQINETGKHPKAGVLEPLALPTCKSCTNYSGTVRELVSGKTRYTGDSFQIVDTVFPEVANHDVVEVTCEGLRLQEVDGQGRVVQTYPKDGRGGLVFYIAWSHSWKVSEIKVDRPASGQ